MRLCLLAAVGCVLIVAASAQPFPACSSLNPSCEPNEECINGRCISTNTSCTVSFLTTLNFENATLAESGFSRVVLAQSSCAEDQVCVPLNNRITGACATITDICIDDEDCGSGICAAGYCAEIPCSADEDCPYNNSTCTSDGICVRPLLVFCESDEDCILLDQVCDQTLCTARSACTNNFGCTPTQNPCINGECFLARIIEQTTEPSAQLVPQPSSTASSCSTFESCASCTPREGCGFCGASGICAEGTEIGPDVGACPSRSWAWTLLDCSSG